MEVEDESDIYLPTFRQDLTGSIVFSIAYLAVFVLGLIGNFFVVLAVALHPSMRTTTDYLIFSLATADLLIILFCLPTTLLNNLLIEWQLGSYGCKLSTFVNSTTTCVSIFTLVAVTGDRFFAICKTLRYAMWEASYTLFVVGGIWIVSSALAIPNLVIYEEVKYEFHISENITQEVRLCLSENQDDFFHFITVNLISAFLIPLLLISFLYGRIFWTVTNRQSLAVDAHVRDERIKIRLSKMMFIVIVIFVACWTPLYGLYLYFFLAPDRSSAMFMFASNILRPVFQWLSLLSSSLNPIIYVMYSQKYRRAFNQILLYPCQSHFENIRNATWQSFNARKSLKNADVKKSFIKKNVKRDDSNFSKTEQTCTTNISLIEARFEEASKIQETSS